MPSPLRAPLAAPFIVLCEGAADRACLAALRDKLALPEFDLPFPPDAPETKGEPALHGLDGFVNMLRRIEGEGALDRTLWQRLRGVVIVADHRDDAAATLGSIVRQCRAAGFAAPAAAGRWESSPPPRPPLAVLLVPQTRPGGLETLCLEHLRARHGAVAQCLDQYLACIPPLPAGAERRAKAALACVVAAISHDNPTRSLAWSFAGDAPLVDVTDAAFAPLAASLRCLLAPEP
jgi:hypothetical protein